MASTKTKKTKNKKSKLGILGILLVSLLAICITLAFLQSHTPEETNTFTLGEGVEIELEQEQTQKVFAPGVSYNRKAVVKVPAGANISNEFIAVKIYFYQDQMTSEGNLQSKSVESAEEFNKEKVALSSYSDITATSTGAGQTTQTGTRNGWVMEYTSDSNCVTCYYGTKTDGKIAFTPVSTGSAVTVFDFVSVNQNYADKYDKASTNPKLLNGDGTETEMAPISAGQMKNFRIVVDAYAVQGDISNEQAMQEFNYMFRNTTSASS